MFVQKIIPVTRVGSHFKQTQRGEKSIEVLDGIPKQELGKEQRPLLAPWHFTPRFHLPENSVSKH